MSALAPCLLLLVGAPGSGKSTWAAERFKPGEIVSLDSLREMVSDDAGRQDATPHAVRAMHAIVEGRLALGRTTVVDATNAVPEHRAALLELGRRHNAQPIMAVFHTPVEECLARNAERDPNRRVPEAFIKDTHASVREQFPVEKSTAETVS